MCLRLLCDLKVTLAKGEPLQLEITIQDYPCSSGKATAIPLEEAKHGMLSYFLMKGMEGEADAN